MSFRNVLLTAGLALALAPAAADAATEQMRFEGWLKGSQSTRWNEPYHGSPGSDDCYHVNFVQAHGNEEWRFSQSTPTKVLVTRIGSGTDAFLHYGNFNPQAMGKKGIVVSSQIDRHSEHTWITKPGECGGTAENERTVGSDCGSMGTNSYGDLNFTDGRAELDLVHEDRYRDCPLNVPEGLMAGQLAVTGPKMRGIDLLNPKKRKHVIRGSESWQSSHHVPDGGTLTATTTVKWQLVLKRVR